MEGLQNIQLDLHNKIKKSLVNYKKSPTERITKEYIEARLENLESDWVMFRTNNAKLCEISKPDELAKSVYVSKDVYEITEDNYLVYKSLMKVALKQFVSTDSEPKERSKNGDRSSQLVRLPKISIPVFSGLYSEWITFRDLFISLVDRNETLDNVQKLHYLKTHLSGEAAQLIRHTPITDANYSQCWDLLEKRYNNKKYLSDCILKRLFGQRRLNVESASGLKELLDTTMDCMNGLANLQIDVSTWDIIVIHIVTLKLDSETRKQWELHISNFADQDKLPSIDQLKTFLENRFRALEFVDTRKLPMQSNSGAQVKPRVLLARSNSNSSPIRCEFCSENHKLCFCKKFAKLECIERRDFVAKNSICFNCLGSNHSAYECFKPTTCRVCKKRHHSLLHLSRSETDKHTVGSTTKEPVEDASSASASPIVTCLSTRNSRKVSEYGQVLLATALVNVESESGGSQMVRALLDQGSQACFITEGAVQLLRLKKNPVSGTVTGLGGDKTLTSKYIVTLNLKSRIDPEFSIQLDAYVLKNITTYLPGQPIAPIDWIKLKDLCLADPQFNICGKIDMLLGANILSTILKKGMKKSPDGALVAQSTTLGWILSGTVHGAASENRKISVMHAQINENDELRKFWELEEQTNSTVNILTEEEQKCENIFNRTTQRTPDGRYVVKLPFRDNQLQCLGGNSRQIAVAKFKSLEKRLSKDTNLKNSYREVMNEYLNLGHMRPVSENDKEKDEAVYLPHHAVVRNDKTTTKVRVVFNASSKNSNGVSLNDTLMVGPKIQADLRHLVSQWRVHPIALVADIIKMYRQVNISEEDTIFQRIVWRENPEAKIQDFELTTVTFGTASAPYLAVRALKQVSLDVGNDYPLASSRVEQSFYMDDLMTGCSDVSDGMEIYKQMKELLSKGGFKLQKWNSNDERLLSEINIKENEQDMQDKESLKETDRTTDKKERKEIDIKTENTTKVLGLTWDRSEDHFRYTVNLSPTSTGPETKRTILSIIARLYDPLGWIAPSIVIAKMFIQKLWLASIGWDEPIPAKLKAEWLTYQDQLHQLTAVKVPRWLGTAKNSASIELHGFSDASKFAYAAVVYARVIDSTGDRKVTLVAAKTKVAPIKQVSIPRLELCGAVLLARLLKEISEVLNLDKTQIKAWTDSTVVLAWINSHPSRWKTFVANRVSEIVTTLDPSQWYHVTSKENPADGASRGIEPRLLAESKLWFTGPDFLKEESIPYKRPMELRVHLEEAVVSHHATMAEDGIIQRFSSLPRMLRVIAYCRRFYKRGHKTTYLCKSEIDQAFMLCIKKVQSDEFNEEVSQLQAKGCLTSKSSKLKALCPYFDENGIMRVSGRIQNSNLPVQTKHPIILPHSSHFTQLVVADAHRNTLHGGIQIMVNFLRTRYWIIGVKSLVKQHVRKCVTCVRHKAQVQTPLMGSLPSVRCIPARAFLHSAVDYAGPIKVRTSKGRGHTAYKGYICLFICLATRAIHLEVVSDMSTQAFLAAFRRFTSRRGNCAQMWSDNGTTFVGASKELRQLYVIQNEAAAHLASHGTEWHFIPPHAPNFGGLWESGVKSTKFHLKRVLAESTLTFEELSTLLCQVEACLNSRPITVDSSDPSDPRPLTPGHFLIGGPLISVPDTYNYLESSVSSLTRWQFIQKMLQGFWRRWSQEYLSSMMNRYKWNSRVPEPNIGDIVLIKEDDMPPSRWLMGKINGKHPGADNITRVVSIRMKNSTIKRPTSKICILPVNE